MKMVSIEVARAKSLSQRRALILAELQLQCSVEKSVACLRDKKIYINAAKSQEDIFLLKNYADVNTRCK